MTQHNPPTIHSLTPTNHSPNSPTPPTTQREVPPGDEGHLDGHGRPREELARGLQGPFNLGWVWWWVLGIIIVVIVVLWL